MEEAGLQVGGLALAAAKGLGEDGRIQAGQKQSERGKGQVWLKRLSITCYNLANGEGIFSQPAVK